MTEELVQWLHEQLDEDERVQRSTFRSTWECGDPCTECGKPAEELYLMSGEPCAEFRPCGDEIYDLDRLARYQEPAPDERVLCEIDAKRHVLRQLESAEVSLRNAEFGSFLYELLRGSVNSLRAAVNALATVYADRPGYRDEWRP